MRLPTATTLALALALTTSACAAGGSSEKAGSSSALASPGPALRSEPASAPAPSLAEVETAGTAPAAPVARQRAANTSATSPVADVTTEPQPSDTKKVSLTEAEAEAATVPDRKIIRNADIVLEIEDPAGALRRIGSIAEKNGGYVVTSDSRQVDGRTNVTMTVRVPADKFDATIEAIHGGGGRVLQEKVTGQDVTEEFIDLEARLRVKRALEAQIMELMKRAQSVSEAYQVQTQLAGVRTEIEQLEGRLRFLQNRSSISTIQLTLHPPVPVVATTGNGFADALKGALSDGVEVASAIVVGLVRLVGVAIPVGVMILLPLFLAGRFVFRRLRRRSEDPRPISVTHT